MTRDSETRRLDRDILAFIRSGSHDERRFNALASRLFRYQIGRNDAYRRFCRSEGISDREIRDWREVPAMPCDGFKELRLACFEKGREVRVFRTSGTTRQRVRGEHPFDTLSLYRASLRASFERFLLPDGARLSFHCLTESPRVRPDSSLSWMLGEAARSFAVGGAARFHVRDGVLDEERALRDLSRERRPVLLLTTASSLQALLDRMRRSRVRLRLRTGSRLMQTGGLKTAGRRLDEARLYRLTRERLGIPLTHCVSEYGMTELSSQCYDTTLADHVRRVRRRPFKAAPGWLGWCVVDPVSGRSVGPGRRGLLKFFDLANRGSVAAIQTEDEAVVRSEGFDLIGRAAGSRPRGCSLTYESLLEGGARD